MLILGAGAACEAVAKATTIGSLAEQPAVDGVHVLSGVDDGSSRNRLPRRKGRAKTALMNCPRLASATSASAFGVRFLLRSIADPLLYQSSRALHGDSVPMSLKLAPMKELQRVLIHSAGKTNVVHNEQ